MTILLHCFFKVLWKQALPLRRFAVYLVAALAWLGTLGQVSGQPVSRLTKIADGLIVDGDPQAPWTDRVLLARPRVAAGDLDELSELVQKHAELLCFVLMARVEPVAASDPPQYVLSDVGVGLAAKIDGRLRVVTGPVATGKQALRSVHLGFIANRVVSSAEQSLDAMRIIVRRTTLMIFDSPAVLHLRGANRDVFVRSMIWIEPDSGKVHHALWAIRNGQQRAWEPALDHGVYLPVPFEEDRILRVDGDQFRFGIPTASAFGLAALPPGLAFPLEGNLADLACRAAYDEDALGKLAAGLIAALRRRGDPATD